MKKIVIAADSFKGSISSHRFAEVATGAIKHVLPECEVISVPLGDGGEGTASALGAALGSEIEKVVVCDPLGRKREAEYFLANNGHTAIMEMAAASGLPLLVEDERNPWETTTYGTGQMIDTAIGQGCRKIMIGIGGSATNDGGMGMLTALGARFYDKNDRLIESLGCGADLAAVGRIDFSSLKKKLDGVDITVACDVDNPLYGPRGAAEVFARQKGADDDMVARLDKGMMNFADVLNDACGHDIADMAGAGAAGGLGAALAAIGARLLPGIEMVLEALNFKHLIKDADLIITGEGRIDSQTLMGKAPAGVLAAGKRNNIPVVAIGGSVAYNPALLDAGFAGIFSIQTTPMCLSEALIPSVAEANLAATIREIVNFAYVMQANRPIIRKNS